MAEKKKEEEAVDPTPIAKGKWDDYQDLFDGEDEGTVASTKARVLARRIQEREVEAKELAEKEAGKKKKKGGNAFL